MELLLGGAAQLGIDLTVQQQEQFAAYYRELIDWNSRMNLTAITGYEEAQVKHFVDSLATVLAFKRGGFAGSVSSVMDVGSGGGFPGIPLKLAFPSLRVVLLESTRKKVVFLNHIIDCLGLKHVEVVAGRAEEVAHQDAYREQFSLVVARALARLPSLVELTVPFAEPGGAVVALRKGEVHTELRSSMRIIKATGGKLRGLVPVELEHLTDGRVLVVVDKIARTPAEYPRRTGLPVKKPILG